MSRTVIWEQEMPPLGRAVIAMGVFDGVHVGHQALLSATADAAKLAGVSSAVLTFDRDPDQVVSPDRAAPQLLTLQDKLHFLEAQGLDVIVVVPFCARLANTTPDRFLDDIVLEAFVPVAIHIGHDFRYGKNASGSVSTLRSYGGQHGFQVVAHDLVSASGEPVTSTRIRSLVAAGDVAVAAELLGRAHRVAGRVVRGRGAGASTIGIPTANVAPASHSALPADGVYRGRAITTKGAYDAAISVGRPPSFDDARDVLEAHLLDFEGDLYATDITLEFLDRLRDLDRFEEDRDLTDAIRGDIERVRAESVAQDA